MIDLKIMSSFKNLKFLIIFLYLVSISNATFSQNSCDNITLSEAKKNYETGKFNDVIISLNNCLVSGFNKEQKIQAYRLLSLTYLALDKYAKALDAANKLLTINPNFEANLFDPPKFIRMIDEIKKIGSNLQVTSVSKKAENLHEAPATVVLVTEEEIKRRGYNDLEMIMHDLPGFDISRSNGNVYSHIYQRGYKSINTNRTLFLVDGVEDNDLWSSNVYLSRQFPMSNIKNIEVVYGPASTMYGSNAFLGVVNVITKGPDEIIASGKQFGINAQAGYGSYDTKFIDASFAARSKNQKVAFSLTGRVFLSDEQDLSGFSNHDFAPLELTDELKNTYKTKLGITNKESVLAFLSSNPFTHTFYTVNSDTSAISLTDAGVEKAWELDNSVYEKTKFSDKTEAYSINAKMKLYDFTLGWMYWNKEEGPGAQYDDLSYFGANEGQQWAPVHNMIYAKYDKDINEKLNISNFLRYKVHDFKVDNRIVRFRNYRYSEGRRYSLANLVNEDIPRLDSTYLYQMSSQLRNEFKILYTPTSSLDIIFGFETRFSSIQGDYLISTTDTAEQKGFFGTNIDGGNHLASRDIGLYLQSSYKITPTLKLTAGLRYDNNKVRANEGYGDAYNPRIALLFTPGKFIFKAIYAEAFKDATNREKYSTAAGKRELSNPLLEPEKVKNYEIEAGRLFSENLYLNVIGYYSFYSNLIQEVKVPYNGGTTNQNTAIGKQEVMGIQSTANYKFKDFQFYANYTFTDPKNIDPFDADKNPLVDANGNVVKELRIGDIASNQINIGGNYLFKKVLNINLRANYVGAKKVGEGTTSNTNPDTFKPYTVLFGSVSYYLIKYGLTFQFTVNNILDAEYYSPGLDNALSPNESSLIQNGRNIHLKVIYNL